MSPGRFFSSSVWHMDAVSSRLTWAGPCSIGWGWLPSPSIWSTCRSCAPWKASACTRGGQFVLGPLRGVSWLRSSRSSRPRRCWYTTDTSCRYNGVSGSWGSIPSPGRSRRDVQLRPISFRVLRQWSPTSHAGR